MTVVAGITALYMPVVFALGNHSVVAALTAADYGEMIDTVDRFPNRALVTETAIFNDRDVVGRRCAGLDQAAPCMAADAERGCALENSLDMACIAADTLMG